VLIDTQFYASERRQTVDPLRRVRCGCARNEVPSVRRSDHPQVRRVGLHSPVLPWPVADRGLTIPTGVGLGPGHGAVLVRLLKAVHGAGVSVEYAELVAWAAIVLAWPHVDP
jgi:hypothetical protein